MVIPSELDQKYYYWDQCNTMVLSWILRAVSPTIGQCAMDQYGRRCLEGLEEAIQSTRRASYWRNPVSDSPDQARPIPGCKCSPSCECGNKLSEMVKAHFENDMLSSFLIGLNENYVHAKNQIMLMKPLPDVGEAFSMISQQERQISVGSNSLGDITEASAFFTKSENNNRRSFPNQKQRPVCSYCGYTGHTIERCYKKHGYPPGWKPRNRNLPSANQVQTSVQETDSLENSSPATHEDYKRFLEFMQKERVSNTPLDTTPHVNTIAANFISNAQMEGKAANSNDSKSLWILDSGATHHIVCSMHLLHVSKKVQGIHVDLPNGHRA
ncbi:uncharacterized protein LOC116001145 [Ipomoea triloba]|uniref:uncharacterized protein LOC116001145 n=1 Tax=Ipomoea triloba TaxID=35885 RepID=UPI00125D8599|nr:uncharacterized protein LOC116001145 [Ipomoea triloba]